MDIGSSLHLTGFTNALEQLCGFRRNRLSDSSRTPDQKRAARIRATRNARREEFLES